MVVYECWALHNICMIHSVRTCILNLLFFTDICYLFEISAELMNVAHNWRRLGLALRLHPPQLDRIEKDKLDVISRLEAVLTAWLNKNYDTTLFGSPSWELLVAAVAHPAGGNNRALAEQIANKHNGKCIVYCAVKSFA